MTEEEIYFGLQMVFNAVLRRQDIKVTSQLTADDIAGWDSFKHVNMLVGAEKYFNCRFDSSDVEAMETFGDLAQAIAKLTV